MTSHVRITYICLRLGFATLQICQLTTFEATRRGQVDVSEPRNLCSRTRVKDINHVLSQRRVDLSYALRVSPAVARLTGYRRPQVSGRVVLEAHDVPRAHHRYLLQDRWCEALSSREHNLKITRSSRSNGRYPFSPIFQWSDYIQMKNSRHSP